MSFANIHSSFPVTDSTTKANETCEEFIAGFQKLTNKIDKFMKLSSREMVRLD